MSDPRRLIPRTDVLLSDARLADVVDRHGLEPVKQAIHEAQQQARRGDIAPADVPAQVISLLAAPATALRPVLNATGVVLHTNLGRAALSETALMAIQRVSGHVDVEYDVVTGARAPRGRGTLDALRAAVPDAEDVHVVNNGAAALILVATALARGRQIIISRGEMVEIGDGFRIPDLLESTGACLREVGTTNRTRPSDYAAAIGEDTAFILKVHPSNFRVEGFTSAASIGELAALPAPVVVDIGSGLLAPDPMLPMEPDATTGLREGATLITSSGDKLLGGPQAGLLLGRRDVVQILRRHPLARALRADKLTLAGLEATLRWPDTPTRRALTADPERLRARAQAMAADLTRAGLPAGVIASNGVVGGGGAPGHVLPGWAVRVPEKLDLPLRTGDPCVVGRLDGGACLIDLRCIPPTADPALLGAVLAAAGIKAPSCT